MEVALGLLACLFYAVHAAHFIARRQQENVLWFCHLGALLVGFGLMLRWPLANAVGFLWLTIGTPLWLVYVATGGELLPGSVLTHFGGVAFGLVGLRRFGLPRGAWWKALAALVPVLFLTRLVTPPAANVNLAFAVWPGWEWLFPSHLVYLLCLASLSAAVFFGVSALLERIVIAPREAPQ